MNIFRDFFNFVKKNCNDDVCLMIVFIIIGFLLCYLFKDNISGFADFAPFEKTISDDKVVVDKPNNIQMEKPIGQVLRPMKPEPTPSTKKALEVMGMKEPVQKNIIQQKVGLMTDSATNFRPFDEKVILQKFLIFWQNSWELRSPFCNLCFHNCSIYECFYSY